MKSCIKKKNRNPVELHEVIQKKDFVDLLEMDEYGEKNPARSSDLEDGGKSDRESEKIGRD